MSADATVLRQVLPGFPAARENTLAIPAPLARRGFFLRPLGDDDLPWLRDLYADTRAAEVAAVPWPDTAKRAFLDQQFALQHHHYLAHFPEADYLAIAHREHGPIGRYYLQRTAPEHLIVDISLLPQMRGHGIGSTLIRHSQAEAMEAGRGMCLHVAHHNPAARRLYERLAFRAEGDAGAAHQFMRWAPPQPQLKMA